MDWELTLANLLTCSEERNQTDGSFVNDSRAPPAPSGACSAAPVGMGSILIAQSWRGDGKGHVCSGEVIMSLILFSSHIRGARIDLAFSLREKPAGKISISSRCNIAARRARSQAADSRLRVHRQGESSCGAGTFSTPSFRGSSGSVSLRTESIGHSSNWAVRGIRL